MNVNATALMALSATVVLVIGAAGLYLAKVRMPRPPVGVYTSGDIAVLCAGVVLAPLVYAALPGAVVSGLFGLVFLLAVQFTLAPLFALISRQLSPWSWPAALAPAACVGAAAATGHHLAARTGSDLLLAVAVVGVANLWTQSGMRSRQVAVLAVVLAVYDLIATTLTDTTTRFAEQVQNRPFAPMLTLTGGAHPVGLGLGDLLLLVLFPLVAAKAFGRAAGWCAAGVGVVVTSAVSLCFALGLLTSGFPLLTALGPVIAAQHVHWSGRRSAERTTAQWRAGDRDLPPGRLAPTDGARELDAALAAALPGQPDAGPWVAVSDGRVVGSGPTPGRARRDAREHGVDAPVLVRMV